MNWPSFLLGAIFTLAAQGLLFSAVVAYYTFKALRERGGGVDG